jgi:hypothetical protein
MKSHQPFSHLSPGEQRIEALLKLGRYLGMLGLLGGLAALSAMWAFGPVPETIAGWQLLIGLMRPVFYTCFFAGVIVLVFVGSLSWWRHRHHLHGRRWFRVMMLALLVAIPALHLTARAAARDLYAAIDAGDLSSSAELWDRLGLLYLLGFLVLLVISAIGVFKPRLGEREVL